MRVEMGKKNNIFFVAFLCAMLLVALMPVTTFAANAGSVYIGTAELNSTNPYYHNGASGAQGTANNISTDYNAYYNAATGTLTLNGLNFTSSNVHRKIDSTSSSSEMVYAISSDGDVSLVLTGDSMVSTMNTDQYHNYCVRINGALTVSGSGSLTATAGAATASGKMSVGIYVMASNGAILTVSSGSLTGQSNNAMDNSYGVDAYHGITVSGTGSLTGSSTNFNASFSHGVYTNGSVTVSDNGSITGTGGRISGTHSFTSGIYADTVTVSDSGSITGTAGKVEGYGNGYGINAKSRITFNGGSIIGNTVAPDQPVQITNNQAMRYLPVVNASTCYWRTSSDGTYSTASLPDNIHKGSYAELTTATPLTYEIALESPAGTALTTHTFPVQLSGYSSRNVPELTVTVKNTGYQPTGDLTIELSGGNAGAFSLSTTSLSSIAAGSEASFEVAVVGGFAPSTYNSTVTVRAANGNANPIVAQNFGAHFTVKVPSTYTVSYDANGGSGTMSPITATEGLASTLPACDFTAPPGKRFKEWAIGSADSQTRIAANGTHTFIADTTVYAMWEDSVINDAPTTGDAQTAALWIGLLLTAGLGISLSVDSRRSRKKEM